MCCSSCMSLNSVRSFVIENCNGPTIENCLNNVCLRPLSRTFTFAVKFAQYTFSPPNFVFYIKIDASMLHIAQARQRSNAERVTGTERTSTYYNLLCSLHGPSRSYTDRNLLLFLFRYRRTLRFSCSLCERASAMCRRKFEKCYQKDPMRCKFYLLLG